ncbi:transporter [Quatrionicoccus australiensis]|uniref:transporter n=1 Tax=Quatrionicoccus australiensis TaxID=138118 RepID=UPI001CF9CB6C|nr:transporter [Quatrionicoccus australiensis]MCB4361069.1 transporter [Quatrionicoccus australiensis]
MSNPEMKMPIRRHLAAATALMLGLSANAAVNDVLPADFFPLATGTTTFAVYAYNRQFSGPYSHGNKLLDGELSSQIVALRAGHFIEVAGMPVSLVAVLPWSQNAVSPTPLARALGEEARGLGDLRFGATGWLLANRESGEYIGLTSLLFVPSGDYDSRQALNVGENRYKFTLNGGWIKPLGSGVIFELVPEVAWFGDNTDYVGGRTLKQKTAYALSSHLRYRANQNWQFHLGSQINRGGETRINAVDQHNAPDNSRAVLGTTYLTDDKSHQFIFRVARDLEVKNGFKINSEIMLRYMKIF